MPEIDKCIKSPTGEHVWNYSPRPDNQRLGICRYCEIQRIFPGAMIPTARPLPPPPIPQQTAPKIIPFKVTTPPADPSAPSAKPVPTVRKVTEPKVRKVRRKPIQRTPAEKLKIIKEYRTASGKRGGKRSVLQKYGISNTVLASWLEKEETLRKLTGVGMEPAPKKQPDRLTEVPYKKRLKIINEYLSSKVNSKAEFCASHNVGEGTFDHWLRMQGYYRDVIARGAKAIHSEIGKRAHLLRKLAKIDESTPQEAIKVLSDWREIVFRDATRTQRQAEEGFKQAASIDDAISIIKANIETQKLLQLEAIKKIMGAGSLEKQNEEDFH